MAVSTERTPTALTGIPRHERWWPSTGGVIARVIALTIILGAYLVIPALFSPVFQPVIAKGLVFGIVALSMNQLMGYAGQVSLGHNAFVGVGAFAAGIIVTNVGLPYGAAMMIAAGIGAVAAVILGGVALRVRGLLLALVTLAYGLFAVETLFNIRALTGGGAGMPLPRPSFAQSHLAFIYFVFAILALVWLFDWRLTSSKAGRAIQALRDDERVAASWGINVTNYKLLAFTISGAVAGIAGVLFASITEIASPFDFGLTLAFTFVLMTVVGGLGSRPGVVQGGFVFGVLPTLLDQAHDAWTWWPFTSVWEPLIGAALLILTLVFFPGGIAQQQKHMLNWLSFRPFHDTEHVAVGADTAGGDSDAHA
jgi:branched-chain amino acid transport system permease protein